MTHAVIAGRINWPTWPTTLVAAGLLAGCVPGDPYYYEPYPPSGGYYYYYYAPSPPAHYYWRGHHRSYGYYPEYRHFP